MTVDEALQQVEKTLDDVGESLSPDDWIDLCGQLEDNTRVKREAAEEEQEDGES